MPLCAIQNKNSYNKFENNKIIKLFKSLSIIKNCGNLTILCKFINKIKINKITVTIFHQLFVFFQKTKSK